MLSFPFTSHVGRATSFVPEDLAGGAVEVLRQNTELNMACHVYRHWQALGNLALRSGRQKELAYIADGRIGR
jgi:hypothetical protein